MNTVATRTPVRQALARTIFRRGWDIRARSLPPARLIRPLVQRSDPGRPTVLDVGCGEFGLAAFLDDGTVVGTDLGAPAHRDRQRPFLRSSILALPFADRTYPLVTCVDVLEHLSREQRAQAIGELVRVSSGVVLIACPHGETALRCDEDFRQACASRNRQLPEWLVEHQRNPYPESDEVQHEINRQAARTGRSARIAVSYTEHANVCRALRAVAARSDLLYMGVNLVLGALFDALPAPGASSSYRMMLLAHLDQPAGRPG